MMHKLGYLLIGLLILSFFLYLRVARAKGTPQTSRVAQVKERVRADLRPGFLCELYAPKDEANIGCDDRAFYSRRNATYLDSARRAIAC